MNKKISYFILVAILFCRLPSFLGTTGDQRKSVEPEQEVRWTLTGLCDVPLPLCVSSSHQDSKGFRTRSGTGPEPGGSSGLMGRLAVALLLTSGPPSGIRGSDAVRQKETPRARHICSTSGAAGERERKAKPVATATRTFNTQPNMAGLNI